MSASAQQVPPYQNSSAHRASITASISSLTNTIIGAGMLALPSAFATMGWFMGSFMIIFCAATTLFGLVLVKLCCDHIGTQATGFYDLMFRVNPYKMWILDLVIGIKVRTLCLVKRENSSFSSHTMPVLWSYDLIPDYEWKSYASGRLEHLDIAWIYIKACTSITCEQKSLVFGYGRVHDSDLFCAPTQIT